MFYSESIQAKQIYSMLLDQELDGVVEEALLGLTWSYCQVKGQLGLAMSPASFTRNLPWPGSLRGRSVKQLAQWIMSWQPHEASLAMAAINACVNQNNTLQQSAQTVMAQTNANLAIFDYFLPRIENKRVVVVGRYPGLETIQSRCNMTVLERYNSDQDLPDLAAEYVIPDADWVFLTATSIVNKSFPRLVELAQHSNLVLMGPTVPWLDELSDLGIDFLAGVRVNEASKLKQTIAEGGGTRIFTNGVEYCIADLGKSQMQWQKYAISDLVARRERIKHDMDEWYRVSGKGRFPGIVELENIDRELSLLDNQFKRMWDARYAQPFLMTG